MSNTQPKLSKIEEQNFTSLGNILGILIGFISPLIFWLVYKDRSKFLDINLKSALNFQLTMIVATIAALMLSPRAPLGAATPIPFIRYDPNNVGTTSDTLPGETCVSSGVDASQVAPVESGERRTS
jgi:uncharacterized Tic20 family protein